MAGRLNQNAEDIDGSTATVCALKAELEAFHKRRFSDIQSAPASGQNETCGYAVKRLLSIPACRNRTVCLRPQKVPDGNAPLIEH